MFLAFILLIVFLLLLNAFFVLAEFAVIKVRPSQVEELIGQGSGPAKLLKEIQSKVDQYLSVCQVGITVASISLGAVAEKGFAHKIGELMGVTSGPAHTLAVSITVILASALHVVVGEQVPKMVAIRRPEASALWTARALRVSWYLFYVPLVVLNATTQAILRCFGIRGAHQEEQHSEEELRIILAQSQRTGLMSFRRLLFLENIFDLGGVKVRDAMRLRDGVRCLRVGASWEETFKVIRDSKFSRYPLLVGDGTMPVGVVHVKDLFYAEKPAEVDLRTIARPYVTTSEDVALENLLGDLQRHRGHLAMVKNAEGKWVGFLTLEDIIEEIIGTIEDEFEVEPPIHLADALTAERTVLGIEASSLEEAIGQAFGRVRPQALPLPPEKISRAVLERERAMSTYLGNGLAIPHARLEGIDKPSILFARSEAGIPIRNREEKAHLIFILMTPAGSPRVQVRLLAKICSLIDSEFVMERLLRAESPAAVVEAIRSAEPTTVR